MRYRLAVAARVSGRFLIAGILLLITCAVSAQTMISLHIVDGRSGESLPYASIGLGDQGFVASSDGTLSLPRTLFEMEDSLQVSYVGYLPLSFASKHLIEGKINRLEMLSSADLPTVEVSVPRSVFNGSISAVSPGVEQLRAVPQLAGQRDILKALQLLPGVSGGVEGTAGLNIRGGNDSHTHLLIDGNAVYNANHIGGLLSSVPDFGVKQLTLYKGGVPSRFGGRLGGVVDLRLRDGRQDGYFHEAEIGTGLLSLGSEGKLSAGLTYLVAGRAAYPTLIDRLIRSNSYVRNVSGNYQSFDLRDGVAKVTYRNGKVKITGSYFGSGDRGFAQFEQSGFFNFEEFNWQTNSTALNGSLEVSPTIRLQANLGYSNYHYRLYERVARRQNGEDLSEAWSSTNARLNDLKGNLRLDIEMSTNVAFRIGTEVIQHDYFFNRTGTSDENNSLDTIFSDQAAIQYAAYSELSATLGGLTVDAGLRRSGMPEIAFGYFEPRVRIGYRFPENWFLNLGADKQVQYMHRLRADQTIFPNEFWQLATKDRPPAQSRQFYAGGAREWTELGLFISMEAYFRDFNNLTESDPLLVSGSTQVGDLVDRAVSDGEGSSRGVEMYAEWRRENYELSLAYTWSKTDRSFPEINNGEPFPFTFDRRHDLSLVGTYRLPKYWTLNGAFIYQTGRAVTAPTRVTTFFYLYERVNNARFPPFHLLNLSIEKQWLGKKNKNTRHRLIFSTYNTYNRDNPYFIALTPVAVQGPDPRFPPGRPLPPPMTTLSVSTELRTRSLFPLLPAIAYRRTFGAASERR